MPSQIRKHAAIEFVHRVEEEESSVKISDVSHYHTSKMALRAVIIENKQVFLRTSSRLFSSACDKSSGSKSSDRKDLKKVTHTGQVFDEKDYRNVRFTNAKRFVNENWGIKLIDEIPPKECTERVVCCDGGNGPLGHPKVYINLDQPGAHICGYCGLRFIKKDHH